MDRCRRDGAVVRGMNPRSGDLVRVRSWPDILATLDEDGELRGLPFMPEMLRYCGGVFRVAQRVHKTCVEDRGEQIHKFPDDDIVFLDMLRCSGEAHDACQRRCRIFWRIAWLEPAGSSDVSGSGGVNGGEQSALPTVRDDGSYRCQSSSLISATRPLSRPGKILAGLRDLRTGTFGIGAIVDRFVRPLFRKQTRSGNWLVPRSARDRTPTETLDLRPGELVEVRSREEIEATLDGQGRNRGMKFSKDMATYCGRRARVFTRLDRMISEETGHLVPIRNTVTLEGLTCRCLVTVGGCPRAELHYWREIWLRRIENPPAN